MPNQRTRRCNLNMLGTVIVFAAALLSANCGHHHHYPTVVPGSEHLIVQTDFPYSYWRPSAKPYTPTFPSTSTTTPASYGYFYGDIIDDYDPDESTWQMLPIQIPDDLVGAVNERTTQGVTPVPAYPTTVTPQYGRYPGVTERPHLFHPERLYKEHQYFKIQDSETPNSPVRYEDQYSSYSQHTDSFQLPQLPPRPSRPKKPQSTWSQSLFDQLEPLHQSLVDQLEPLMDTHFSKIPELPKLPSLPGINRLSDLPNFSSWSFGSLYGDKPEGISQSDAETEKYDSESSDDQFLHQFYPIPSQNNDKLRNNKRPGQSPSNNQQTIILSTPFTHDEYQPQYDQALPFPVHTSENVDHLQEGSYHESPHKKNSFNGASQPLRKQTRPQNVRKRPIRINRRPGIKRKHLRRPASRKTIIPSRAGFPTSQKPFLEEHYIADDRISPMNFQHSNSDYPVNNRFRPNNQNNSPFRQPKPAVTVKPQDSPHAQIYSYNNQGHDDNYQSNSNVHRQPKPPSGNDKQDYDYDVLDRLTDLSPLSSTATLPGGLFVVALSLALFYFNFVWYPTPVVTAKLIKSMSDSVPGSLNNNEQKAIEEAYEVFRGLEAEYMEDSDLWEPSCKSRLVCQVHKELPGLWHVTHSSEALVRRSLATGPTGTEDLQAFLEAAREGNQGFNCIERYSSCPLAPIPVQSSLQSLWNVLGDTLPTVVYS